MIGSAARSAVRRRGMTEVRKIYRKPLFELFEQGLQSRMPQWRRQGRASSARRTYLRPIGEGRTAFLELVVDPAGQPRFFCDLAWNETTTLPAEEDCAVAGAPTCGPPSRKA